MEYRRPSQEEIRCTVLRLLVWIFVTYSFFVLTFVPLAKYLIHHCDAPARCLPPALTALFAVYDIVRAPFEKWLETLQRRELTVIVFVAAIAVVLVLSLQ
jgi:hypothetical protein